MRYAIAALLFATAALVAVPAYANGKYLRFNEILIVEVLAGKLFCTGAESGFKVCLGLQQKNNANYFGDKFRFPDSPNQQFTGTISFSGDKAKVKACVTGTKDCRRETWYRQ